jgi:hypothetical protein
LRTSARATVSSSAPSREIRETSSRMVLGWIVGQWTPKGDRWAVPGCESSPHATVVGVDVSDPPKTVVGVRVGIHSVAPAAGPRVG